MINGLTNLGSSAITGSGGGLTPSTGAGAAGKTSFADTLKSSIDEVNRLQQDASQSVEKLVTGKSENVTGVFTAMEKSSLAFQTLLAIRGKLMEAYNDIKNIPM